MGTLIDILKQFDVARIEAINNNEFNGKTDEDKYRVIAKCFETCAIDILCNGYFLINNEYVVDLGAIELYYHEEEGDIKDHIMYHTNEHLPESYKKIVKNFKDRVSQLPVFYRQIANNEYPYFEIGSFNLHQSGIDVTFENPDGKYRASFLIRSYRMYKKEDRNNDILYDPCSSHLYDDLYYSGVLSAKGAVIEWRVDKEWVIDDKKVEKVIQCPRINVAEYRKNEKDKYEKSDVKITDNEYNEEIKYTESKKDTFPQYFKLWKKYYKQDMRLWQFRKKGIQEIGTPPNKFYENATPISFQNK